MAESKVLIPDIDKLIKRFESRADRLRTQANFLLFIVIIMLALGATIFIFAAEITAIDITKTDPAGKKIEKITQIINDNDLKVKKIEDDLENNIGKLKLEQQKLTENYSDVSASLTKKTNRLIEDNCFSGRTYQIPKPIIRTIRKPKDHLVRVYGKENAVTAGDLVYNISPKFGTQGCIEKTNSIISSDIVQLEKMFAYLMAREKTLPEKIKIIISKSTKLSGSIETEQKELRAARATVKIDAAVSGDEGSGAKEDKGKAKDWPSLVQTNVTRFGSLLIILFLVNILIAQYRYNIKLATYYEGRADALSLKIEQLTISEFSDLLKSLTPTLDFGKMPSTPIEQIVELARAVKK